MHQAAWWQVFAKQPLETIPRHSLMGSGPFLRRILVKSPCMAARMAHFILYKRHFFMTVFVHYLEIS